MVARDVVVVCSQNATSRKAERLAFEVSPPDIAPIAEKNAEASLASYRDTIELAAVAAGQLSRLDQKRRTAAKIAPCGTKHNNVPGCQHSGVKQILDLGGRPLSADDSGGKDGAALQPSWKDLDVP